MSSSSSIRSSYITVDLDTLCTNYTRIKSLIKPAQVYAVVKANAYGHGSIPIAQALQAHHADGLCVALAEEGLALRQAGITLPIWILNGIYGNQHRAVIDANLTPIVFEATDVLAFNKAAKTPFNVHTKIDTGLARLGVRYTEFEAFLDVVESCSNIRIDGAMTHLAMADTDAEMTNLQLTRFEAILERLHARGHTPTYIHAANSAATLRYPQSRYTTVRNGITMYGMGPNLEPVLSLHSQVVSVRSLPENAPVGYRDAYRTKRPSNIATIAIGYGDGYPRSLSNRGTVLVHGVPCSVVGEVSMDLTTVDVTDAPEVKPGDEVVIIGKQHNATLSAVQVAEHADISVYELFTRLMPRLPRHYRSGLTND